MYWRSFVSLEGLVDGSKSLVRGLDMDPIAVKYKVLPSLIEEM